MFRRAFLGFVLGAGFVIVVATFGFVFLGDLGGLRVREGEVSDRTGRDVGEKARSLRSVARTFQAAIWPFPLPSLLGWFLTSDVDASVSRSAHSGGIREQETRWDLLSVTSSRNLGSVGFPLVLGMMRLEFDE